MIALTRGMPADQQKYLRERLAKISHNFDNPPEPASVKHARKMMERWRRVLNRWDRLCTKRDRRLDRKLRKAIQRATEAIWFETPGVALRYVRAAERLGGRARN